MSVDSCEYNRKSQVVRSGNSPATAKACITICHMNLGAWKYMNNAL